MYQKIALVSLIATTVLGCAPLKKASTERQVVVTIDDSLLLHLVRSELERSIVEVQQTIVEFYPPQPIPQEPPTEKEDGVAVVSPIVVTAPQGAVRRIVKTEIRNETENKSSTDSLSHSRINTAARCDEQSSLEESPNTSGSSWLKWCAGCLALLLLIIAILKFK